MEKASDSNAEKACTQVSKRREHTRTHETERERERKRGDLYV